MLQRYAFISILRTFHVLKVRQRARKWKLIDVYFAFYSFIRIFADEKERYEMEDKDVTMVSETSTEDSFKTDEFGRIALTKEMREAVAQAERDLEAGKCLSESSFKERFAKWL